jgi:hypothetical protein
VGFEGLRVQNMGCSTHRFARGGLRDLGQTTRIQTNRKNARKRWGQWVIRVRLVLVLP